MKPNYNYSLKVNSEFFNWNSESREFSAEISDLHHRRIDPLGALYAGGANDKGFVMVSKKTRNLVGFKLVSELCDPEGELLFWTFEPTDYEKQNNPDLQNVRVVIYND
jgi:hypothetical protein